MVCELVILKIWLGREVATKQPLWSNGHLKRESGASVRWFKIRRSGLLVGLRERDCECGRALSAAGRHNVLDKP